ncbi:MAG: hypothetical protein UC738_05385, partial [Bacteroides stercoris]|nr:hypothetical protein [Bacteroides stercoris]
MKFILNYRTELSIFLLVPIPPLRWYRFLRYVGTDSCAMMVPFRRYYHVIGSCSQSEIEEQVLKPSVEQVQMEELIQYVEDIKPYVPAPLDVHTRGFWSSFRSWFKNLGKADAGGYRWGRDNGMNFWRGLRVSLTTSLVTAINGRGCSNCLEDK